MRRFLSTAIFVLALALPAICQDVASQIDRYLSLRTEMGNFSGAVLVAQGDRTILRKGYGYLDIEHGVKYTPETRHEVASVSKMFTAFAVLQLEKDKKLNIADPICNYIDNCPEAWRAIKIENLIRHTSGIPDYESRLEMGSTKYFDFMKQADNGSLIIDEARRLPLDFQPGEKFRYSNTAYVILSSIVEKVSGQNFSDFVKSRILGPAGMAHSGVLDKTAPDFVDKPYGPAKDITWPQRLAGFSLNGGMLKMLPQLALASPHGDAAIYSTVDDLFKWSRAMDGGSFVTAAELTRIFSGDYGFGWIIDTDLGEKRYQHNGIMPGYLTEFIKFPEKKVTVIVFSNLDHSRMSVIARDVSAIALGKPYDMPVRGTVATLTKEQVAPLEGEYKMTDGSSIKIQNEPDFLSAYKTGADGKLQFGAGLIPLSTTSFYFPLGDGTVTFTPGTEGKAVKVNFHYRGEDHIAERIK